MNGGIYGDLLPASKAIGLKNKLKHITHIMILEHWFGTILRTTPMQ